MPSEQESVVCPQHHLLIAGTGRAGTSALVQLLSVCGLDTVIKGENLTGWFKEANAGVESDPLTPFGNPYVIKSPWAYQYIDKLVARTDIKIDEVIIPIRRLVSAAASRVITELSAQNQVSGRLGAHEHVWTEYGSTPGGTLNSVEPIDQERILGRSLHLLIERLEEAEIPFHFLSFPRFVVDPEYTWRKLHHLFPEIRAPIFETVFNRVITPSSVRVERETGSSSIGPGSGDFQRLSRPTLSELWEASVLRGKTSD